MTEHKYGKRVLVECDLEAAPEDTRVIYLRPSEESWKDYIHPHPGVPVADLIAERDALLEEVELRQEWADSRLDGLVYETAMDRIRTLRIAREAAAWPEAKEVWVRAEQAANGAVSIRKPPGVDITDPRFCLCIHPDDIYKDDPDLGLINDAD